MRIILLHGKVLENYSYLYDYLQLASKFKNYDWDIFQYAHFQSKSTRYLYSNF